MTMNITGNQFNLNWIDFELIEALSNKANASYLFKLYPNPAHEYVTLQSDTVINHIKVFDLLGRAVFEQNTINQQIVQLNIAHYPSGLYLIEVESEYRTEILKLIKQ